MTIKAGGHVENFIRGVSDLAVAPSTIRRTTDDNRRNGSREKTTYSQQKICRPRIEPWVGASRKNSPDHRNSQYPADSAPPKISDVHPRVDDLGLPSPDLKKCNGPMKDQRSEDMQSILRQILRKNC